MKYDFSSLIDRHGMDSIAVDSWGEIPGMAPNAPDEGFDRIPMWVADMNFATVPTVREHIIQRAQHPMFGYFNPRPEYFDRIIEWQSRRNGVECLRPEHIGYENGVLGGVVSTLRAYVQPGDAVLVHSPTYIGCNPDVMQTFVGQQWLANEGITCTYKEIDTGGALFDALANNEVDAIIMNDTTSSPSASPMFYIGSSDYFFAVPKSRPDLMDDINAAMSAIARVNPRYIDEVKSNYSAQNSGSSSLNGPERSWLKTNDNTITLGYITGRLPYCNEDENGEMEGSLASLATTLHDKFGITVKTVAFDSYKMMSKALSKGSIDVVLPVYRDYWFAEQSGVVQSVSLGTISLTAIHTGSDLNKDLQNIACTKSSFVNKNALVDDSQQLGLSARNPARELTGVRELDRLVVLEIMTVADGFYA